MAVKRTNPLIPAERRRANAEFERLIQRLENSHSAQKHQVWDDVVRILHQIGQGPLAQTVTKTREQGLALARMKRLCKPDNFIANPNFCDRSVQYFLQQFADGPFAYVNDPLQKTLDNYLGEDQTSAFALACRDLSDQLYRLGMQVSVRASPPTYTFYLLTPGEPERVSSPRGDFVEFEYVPTGLEGAWHLTQLGEMVVRVDPTRGLIYVEGFGKDLKEDPQPRARDGSLSAMQLFFGCAISCVALELARRGEQYVHHSTVKLHAADNGTGRLFNLYERVGLNRVDAPRPYQQGGDMSGALLNVLYACAPHHFARFNVGGR